MQFQVPEPGLELVVAGINRRPMLSKWILFAAIHYYLAVYVGTDSLPECLDIPTLDSDLNFAYCNQPLFITFLPKTEQNEFIDNICGTLFPLPDDPNTYNLYFSTVYCDGSTRIESYIFTDIEPGRYRGSNPFCTYTTNVIGYAGCDTYVQYRCLEFGDCDGQPSVVGISTSCRPLGLSCLQKIEDILDDAGVPKSEYVVLPMKLPNRCVTEKLCINNFEGDLYCALNLPNPQPALLPPLLPNPLIAPPPLSSILPGPFG
ncbi:uncharacterized protein LOC124369491 [Homalodisca vitripennis]|uniref:uncharacterized protein LOC124369491 n=1 Tax=Homalodisca vitripennis TaxID=197043 RepID=UPI001EEAEE9E|nr:uncharacterized protein LOC124369491 [Homalodisca vitripennis]